MTAEHALLAREAFAAGHKRCISAEAMQLIVRCQATTLAFLIAMGDGTQAEFFRDVDWQRLGTLTPFAVERIRV